MDIFSAGLVLAEMLMGRQLVMETDPYRAIYRVTNEQLDLPKVMPAGVDDQLRAIVLRALAKDNSKRFVSARVFQSELELWVQSLQGPAQAGEAANNATLEFLLRRMRHKSDFPALSDSVTRIQSMARSDKRVWAVSPMKSSRTWH